MSSVISFIERVYRQKTLLTRLCACSLILFPYYSATASGGSKHDTALIRQIITLAGGETIRHGSVDFISPTAIAFDSLGHIIIADAGCHAIYKISRSGTVALLAGGTYGFADGTGAKAQFSAPVDIAVLPGGAIIILDGNRLRKIAPNGTVTTLVGGERGYTDGRGSFARFNFPAAIAADASGNVIVADAGNNRLRLVSTEGWVSTVTVSQGNPETLVPVDIARPVSVAFDRKGAFIIVDRSDCLIRRLKKSEKGFIVDSLSYRCAGNERPNLLGSVAVDVAGNLIAMERGGKTLYKISPLGEVTTFATNDPMFAISAFALDASGAILIANPVARAAQKIILP